MFKQLAILLYLGIASLAMAEDKARDEWQLLFNGKNMDGWRGYNTDRVGAAWQVRDGTMILSGRGGGDIISEDQFTNFELSLEWKISPKGNSGVFFHVLEGDENAVYWTGPEMQFLDNSRSEPPIEQAGALFALYAPSADYTEPVGQFNEAKIKVLNGHVEHWLNGHLIVSYDMNSQDFKSRVAQSKFARHARFAKTGRGHIALQDHGDQISFRNIRIRRLD